MGKKRTRCWCDCCPDSDLEFPLRTFAFCALFMNMLFFFSTLVVMLFCYSTNAYSLAWLVYLVWFICFVIVFVFYSRAVCECCGGGDRKTAGQKYAAFKVAAVVSMTRILVEWIPLTCKPYAVLYLLPGYLFRLYLLLAAYQLVPPKPIVVVKPPLVVNVIPA